MAASQPNALQSTAELLELVRRGYEPAREELLRRYLPILRNWAHGRLPADARGMVDTDDLVQKTLIGATHHLNEFEFRHEGSFIAYLRKGCLNQIRDEIRKARRRPRREELDEDVADRQPSPLDLVIGSEALERYEKALAQLAREQQEAIVLCIEFGYDHRSIAEALGRPTANAARKFVARALVQLAELMSERD